MFNPNQPLWMPGGSVRAILALLVFAVFAVLAYRSDVKLTSDQIIGVVMVIATAYFVAKAATTPRA